MRSEEAVFYPVSIFLAMFLEYCDKTSKKWLRTEDRGRKTEDGEQKAERRESVKA